MALKKALIERAQGDEMNQHLGYPPGAAKLATVTNQHQRSGTGAKKVLIEDGPIRIEMPRDRDSGFEPLLIPKLQRRFKGFDDKIVATYAPRGTTAREIQGFLLEQYATEVSPESIGSVIDEVMAKVTSLAGQATRSHVFGRVRRRAAGQDPRDAVERNKAVYLAPGCSLMAGATSWACGSKTPTVPSSG